jgi:hypothetical protein
MNKTSATQENIFQPNRLMFGIDRPRSVPAGGRRRVCGELAGIVAELKPAERGVVPGGTATAICGLVG